MTNNNTNTKENKMRKTALTYTQYLQRAKMYRNERNDVIETLQNGGCTNVQVNDLDSTATMGACWSMTLPNGKKFAGGLGAVRMLIKNNFELLTTRRARVRLESDALGKTWTIENGG